MNPPTEPVSPEPQELKLCPFCPLGTNREHSTWCGNSVPGMEDCGYWATGCRACGIEFHADTQAESVSTWNTRAPAAVVDVGQEDLGKPGAELAAERQGQKALKLLAKFDADAQFGRPGDSDCQIASDPKGSSDEDFSVLATRLHRMKQWAQDFWSDAQVILSESGVGSHANGVSSHESAFLPRAGLADTVEGQNEWEYLCADGQWKPCSRLGCERVGYAMIEAHGVQHLIPRSNVRLCKPDASSDHVKAVLHHALADLQLHAITFRRNVEIGDYYICDICREESKESNKAIKHGATCSLTEIQQLLSSPAGSSNAAGVSVIPSIPMPDGLEFRNGGQLCDMLNGPCACGAWHHVEDLPWRVQHQLGYANDTRKCISPGCDMERRNHFGADHIFVPPAPAPVDTTQQKEGDATCPETSSKRGCSAAPSEFDPAWLAAQHATFWPRVLIKNEGCWEWLGAKDERGYGRLRVDGQLMLAHRHAYRICVERIPDGVLVCHRCDHPWCCNPSHLFPGTHADNLEDARSKGRWLPNKINNFSRKRGADNSSSKLTADEVRAIRTRLTQKESHHSIAKAFKVLPFTIDRIATGEIWNHVK